MSELARVAAMIYASQPVQDKLRGFKAEFLQERSVAAAKAIIDLEGPDPFAVALVFGGEHGHKINELNDAQIVEHVKHSASRIESLDEFARVAELEASETVAVEEPIKEPGETEQNPSAVDGDVTIEGKGHDIAVADLVLAGAYKRALIGANCHTVGDVLKYDLEHAAEGGLENIKDIGKVARERILDAIASAK